MAGAATPGMCGWCSGPVGASAGVLPVFEELWQDTQVTSLSHQPSSHLIPEAVGKRLLKDGCQKILFKQQLLSKKRLGRQMRGTQP